jgi:hypothetical protein
MSRLVDKAVYLKSVTELSNLYKADIGFAICQMSYGLKLVYLLKHTCSLYTPSLIKLAFEEL